MKIFDCKCTGCSAEFQAVLQDEDDKVKCPSCGSDKIETTESEMGSACGGCSGCGGGCTNSSE